MPSYRLFTTDPEGHIWAPARIIECSDDQVAIEKAAQAANGAAVELWEGDRFIVRVPSDEPK